MGIIKKKMELVFQPKVKMLIYGSAGMGKTTLALSAPNPLLIDCDNGVHRVNYGHIGDTVPVSSYQDVLDVLKEDLSAYETIVIDTGGKLLDYMAEYIISENPKMGKANGSLTLQGHGERKCEFTAFCKKINMLGKHLVFVAHRQTQQEGDNFRYVPLFGGSNYDALVTELDIVGYLEANGKDRVITFDPTDRNDGKNTCNLPSAIKLPVVVDKDDNALTNNFISKHVIDAYTARLAKSKEDSEAYSRVIAQIKSIVNACKDAKDLNGCIYQMKDIEHIGSSKDRAKYLISAKAKELKVTYNKENGCYE